MSLQETLAHEPLEQRRLLAADVNLDGTILTVAFDDAETDFIQIQINSTGYQTTGSNLSSGTGTITKLVVTDAGTACSSCVSIPDAWQPLTGGLSVDQNVHSVDISGPIDTAGGDVAIDSSQLTLSANINSGSGSQTYGPDTEISLLNDINFTTSTGVAGDIGIHIQGTVDSYFPADPSALYLHSESVKVDDAIGSTTPLETLTVVTENDAAQRGQFLRSVATVGKQAYRAQYTSGDVEFNGTYTTSDSDIELVGIGAYGIYLSLLGNTVIDVGAGSFSVQKVGSSSGGQLFSNGGPYDLSITAANISVPAGMGIDDAETLPNPELGVFTIGGTATTNFDVSQVVATGGIVAAGEVWLQQAATLNSTGGAINLSGGLTLAGDTTLTAPAVEFADGVTGNSHNLTLSPTSSFIKLDGINLSGVNELTIGGDLDLAGDLNAQNIDIQGDTTLLGAANLTATGTASGDWSTASLTNTVTTSGYATKLELSPDGRHAYIADDSAGMQVVDLQHPSGPAIVGNFDSAVGNALDVVANATHAFVSHWMGDLHIVDVSNPSSPQSTGNVSLPDMGLPFGGTPFGLSLHGDALYVADGRAGIHHVDVSDPANPSVSETFGTEIGLTFFGVTVAGGYTFAATSSGLKVYDGARTNVATGSLSGNGDARSVVVSADGQTAFLANFNGGLDIFDISTASSPQHLDNYSTAGLGHDVALSSDETLAFVADGPNGKLVLDVSDTSDIKFVGNHATTGSDTDGNVYDVAVAADDAATFTVTHKSENDPGKAGLDIFSSVTQGISFGGTVDGGYALSTNGATSFAGVVGGSDSLASLTTVGGTVSVGGNVTTTGNQSFGGEATIAGNTTFTGNDVSISGLEGGGFDVEFSATTTTIDANAYSVANVADLNVSGDVGLNGTIATTGNQSYGGDVELLGDTILTSGAGAIDIGTSGGVVGTNGTEKLSLGDASQTGTVTLGGGSSVTLGDLDIGAGAFDVIIDTPYTVNVNSAVDFLNSGNLSITTGAGTSSYVKFRDGLNATAVSQLNFFGAVRTENAPIDVSDVVITNPNNYSYPLGAFFTAESGSEPGGSVTLQSLDTGGGYVGYTTGVTGQFILSQDSTITGFGIQGTGDFKALGNITVGEVGNTTTAINTTGDQNYASDVTLAGNANFTGNTATFTNGVLGGNNSLTINFTQPSKLDGLANVNEFTSLGQIELNGSFATAGSQNFAGGVSLGGDATLHAASGFIKLNGIAGETYDLTIGNTTLPAPTADLFITSDVALNALNATTGSYDASLTGASMKIQQATFDNSGNITLGDEATDSLVIGQGLVVQSAAVTTVAGTIASNGSEIRIRNINLTADTHIDTTNSGMVAGGAQILLDGNMQLNGFALDTKSGAVDTTLEGDITLTNGSFEVLQGDLDLGESGNPSNAANITITETATIRVPENGTLNVFDGSQLDAGDNPINIIANNISFQTNAGSFTSTSEITITPATAGNDIFVGNIADSKTASDGLRINQTDYSKMQSPNLTIGGAGYNGTITVENVTGDLGRLNLIADGTGGAINLSGGLDLDGKDASGISLYVKGSGATTDLNGTITTAGAAFFDDAVRLVGDTNIVTSDGDVTITGGTEGIYSQLGSSHNLSINAGAGDVVVGNQTGFGNGTTESLIGKVTLDSASSITLGEGDQEMHSLDVLNSPLELGGSLGTSLILSGGLFGGADLRTGITGNKSFLEIDLESGFVDVVKLGSITNVNNLAITEDSLSPSPLRKVEMHGDVTTIEGQSYDPTVELRNAILLNAAGNVSINGTLTAQDGLVIPRNVGITATGGTVSIADFGNGTTLGNHYDVAILAADDVNLGGGVGSFDGTTQYGLQFLTINTITNSVNFNAASGLTIGGNLSIESSPNVNISAGATLETKGDLTINSTDISLGASVTTDSGTLTLNGTTSATDSITLSSGSGDLTVTDALLATTAGTHDLNLNSTGTAKIGGAVGNGTGSATTFFNSLTTNAGGTTEFSGNIVALTQTFNDDIVLNGSMSMGSMGTAAGLTATFNGNVDATNSDIQLGFVSTAIDGANWSNLGSLRFEGTEIAVQNTIQSTGDQTYDSTVNVVDNLTLDTGSGDLNISGPLLATTAGTHDVNINSTGTAKIGGAVGNGTGSATTFFNGLTTNAGGTTEFSGNVVALTQTFNDDIVLNGSMNMSGTTTNAGLSATFNGQVDATNSTIQLGFVSTAIDGANWSNLASLRFEGTDIGLQNTLQTTGDQTYIATNPVHLDGDTILVGETLSIANGLDGQTKNLVLNFAQTTSLDGSFANITDLTSEGDVSLNGTITTLGNQAYNASANLAGDTTLEGSSLSVANVDGRTKNLVLNFAQTTSLDGSFANITDLTSEGDVSLNGTIVTNGNQTYENAVELIGTTNLQGTGGTFTGGLDGKRNDLTLNFSDVTTIDGSTVFSNLGILTSVGAVELNGTINTTGSQNYQSSVTLLGDTELQAANGTPVAHPVQFGGTVDGGFGLAVTASKIGFNDKVGGATPLASFTAVGDTTTRLNGGLIETSGSQSFGGSVTLLDNANLIGDSLALSSGVEGGTKNLVLNFAQTTSLDGSFNNITDLTSEGNVSLNGTITTFGNQVYNASANLAGDTTLEGSSLSVANVDGQTKNLVLNFAQTTSLDGSFANITDLTSEGNVSLNGTFATTGFQKYQGSVALSGDTELAATTVEFSDGLTGNSHNLTLSPTSGSITLDVINLSGVNELTVGGDLNLVGDLNAEHIDIQGNTKLLGDANVTADGTVFVPNVAAPTLAGNLDTGDIARDVTLSSDGQYVFVADGGSGLQIIDVSNVAAPTLAGNLDTSGFAHDVTLSSDGQYVFVADGGSGLQIIDVSNVAAPTLAGKLDTSGNARGVTLSSDGQYAFVADSTSGLQIIDVSNVAAPTLAGNLATSSWARGVTLSSDGQYAFVADHTSGLRVIDVSNVAAPTLAGNLDTSGGAGGVTLSSDGQHVFVADGGSGLQIIDVSNVAAPTLAGNLATSDSAAGVTLSSDGQYAFVADTMSGLQIIDVSNVAAPMLTGNLATSGWAYGVTLSSDGHYAFVAGSTSGLQIISLGSEETGSVIFGGTVDGNYALSTNGSTSFTGVVGGADSLASLTTVGGTVSVGGDVTTTGDQTYGGEVTLLNDVTFQGGEGQFSGGLDGNQQDLSLNFTAPVIINGSETFGNIANLSVQNAANLSGTINTTGSQNYGGAVTLVGDTTLQGTSGNFTGGLDGQTNNLQLQFEDTTEIDGANVFSNIGDLNSTGPVRLRGAISTSGFQNYGNTTTLFGDTTLNTGGSGNVSFGNSLDGSHDLSIEAGTGQIDFFGALGGAAPLQSLNLASASAVEALDTLAIDGTGTGFFSGGSAGLYIGPAVDNVNISQPGSTITNAYQEGIWVDGGLANSTIGGFTITNSGESGVLVTAGNYTGSTFSNITVTGSESDGFAAYEADGLSVTDSEFSFNADDGIHFDGVSNATAQNNVIGNNDFYGVLVVSTGALDQTSNVSITGNFIGTNVDEDNTANGRSGIWVLGNARGHGTVDTVNITGNTIANNAVHGIEVWSATNVTLGGTRGESSENIISNNAQYGIAFTDVVTNSFVHGNTLLGNTQAGLYLNSARGVTVGGGVDGKSSLDIQESDFGVVAGGDLTGTDLVGNRIHENRQAGFQLLGARDFHLFRNTIENNGPYGVLAIGDSSNSRISGNTISRHGAGVWLAGARGMVIGSLAGVSNEQAVGNKIEDNSSVGIIIQGEDSFDNVILSNQIDANIYYGIQFVQGARTVSVPRLVSVTTEQITGRITGDDGEVYRIQFFYTPAAQAADGRTSQGEFFIGYEDVTIVDGAATVELDISSSDIVAGDIVTATATLIIDGDPVQSSSFSQGRRVQEAAV